MNNIESLVSEFAAQIAAHVRQSVLADLRHMSLDELFALSKGESAPAPAAAPVKRGPGRPKKIASAAAPAKRPGRVSRGRLPRRSAADIQGTLDQIVAYLHQNPGSRSEEIVAGLGLHKKELPRPIMEGLKSGVLSKEGQKRATQYFAVGGETSKRGRRR
jgi:hypothetical protein